MLTFASMNDKLERYNKARERFLTEVMCLFPYSTDLHIEVLVSNVRKEELAELSAEIKTTEIFSGVCTDECVVGQGTKADTFNTPMYTK